MRTAVVHAAHRCNQRCIFCLEAGRRVPSEPDLPELRLLLADLRRRGAEHVVFMGAETLLRPDAVEIVALAREVGFEFVTIATNGTQLGREGLVPRLLAAGLTDIELSVHAMTAETTRRIAGVGGTFAQLQRGLDAVRRHNLQVAVNVVVCRENLGELPAIAAFVRKALPKHRNLHFDYKFVTLLGAALQRATAAQDLLRLSDFDAQGLGDGLERAGARFFIDNVPLCRLGRHAARAMRLRAFACSEHSFDRTPDGSGYEASGFQIGHHVWPAEPCGACSLRAICPGVESAYVRFAGYGELTPSAAPPLPILRQALRHVGGDPRQAEARLRALQADPRPGLENRPPPSLGVLRLRHPDEPEALDLQVAPRSEQPAFARTERFDLSYRPWRSGEATERPRVREALQRALALLEAADGDQGLAAVQAQLGQQVGGGWMGE